jgi:hypothetical protein
MFGLQRLREKHPEFEPVLLTWTSGYWGNRLMEPSEELKRLSDYFKTTVRVTFPIGIWAGRKIANEDGGSAPELPANFKDYPLIGKPVICVVDGNGIIRRFFTGYDREIERQLKQTIEFLLRETGPGQRAIPLAKRIDA